MQLNVKKVQKSTKKKKEIKPKILKSTSFQFHGRANACRHKKFEMFGVLNQFNCYISTFEADKKEMM